MTEENAYLATKPLEDQIEWSNNLIRIFNDSVQNGDMIVKDKNNTNENEVVITTDTHADLVSLIGTLIACGIKFEENSFIFYDTKNNAFLKKIDDEYFIFNPETGEMEKEPIKNINENDLVAVPYPTDISNAKTLIISGDIADRGFESLTSLLVCKICKEKIKLTFGNHEFNRFEYGDIQCEKEIVPIKYILDKMAINNEISFAFYNGKNDDVVAYSHTALTKDDLISIFKFLDDVYIDSKYLDEDPILIEVLEEKFKNQTEHKNLADKVKAFLANYGTKKQKKSFTEEEEEEEEEIDKDEYYEDNYEIIENNFTKEDMLILKNVVGLAIKNVQVEKEKDIKDFKSFKNHKDSLRFNLVKDDYEDIGSVLCNGTSTKEAVTKHFIGHIIPSKLKNGKKEPAIRLKDEKVIISDDEKSFKSGSKNDKTRDDSFVTLIFHNIETGEVVPYSYSIKREKGGKISELVEKNKREGYEPMNLDNFKIKVPTKDTINSFDFTNDVKKVEIRDNVISVIFSNDDEAVVINKEQKDVKGKNIMYAIAVCDNFELNDKNSSTVEELFNEFEEDEKAYLLSLLILSKANDITKINDFLEIESFKNTFIDNNVKENLSGIVPKKVMENLNMLANLQENSEKSKNLKLITENFNNSELSIV